MLYPTTPSHFVRYLPTFASNLFLLPSFVWCLLWTAPLPYNSVYEINYEYIHLISNNVDM